MAATYNINLVAGDTLEMTVSMVKADNTPFDLTGYTAKSQIRKTVDDSVVLAEFTVMNGPLGTDGKIKLRVEAAETEIFRINPTSVYDVEITNTADTTKRTILCGSITSVKDVTRS